MGSRAGRLGVAIVAGCVLFGAVAASAQAAFLYVTGGPNKIGSFSIDSSGGLTSLGPATTGSTPRNVAITPDAKHVYTIAIGSDTVLGYDISPSGSLSPVSGMPVIGFPIGDNANDPTSIAISPNGAFLYTSYSGVAGRAIAIWAIAANGSLSAVGTPLPVTNINGMAIDPSGTHLYATTDTGVQAFTIAGNGTLSALGALVPVGFSRAIAIRPDGSVAYVGHASNVQALAIAADGTLTAGATTATDANPFGVVVTPTNKFLYTANFTAVHGTVNSFSIDAGGALTPVSGQPFSSVSDFSYAADAAPNGFLYVSNDVGGGGVQGTVSVFAIGADGALTGPGTPVPATVDGPEFESVVVTPNQGPVAALTSTPAAAGQPSTLDASASADPDGNGIVGYAWDFGDGQTATTTTATTTHVYGAAGTYNASATVIDGQLCSTALIFTGQTADCNGSSAAKATAGVVVPQGGGGAGPGLKLLGSKTEKLDAAVEIQVKCNEPCVAAGAGKLVVVTRTTRAGKRELARRKFNLRPASINLNGKKKGTISLKVPRKARRAGLKALKHGGRVTARTTVTATNAAGGATTAKRAVRLVRP